MIGWNYRRRTETVASLRYGAVSLNQLLDVDGLRDLAEAGFLLFIKIDMVLRSLL